MLSHTVNCLRIPRMYAILALFTLLPLFSFAYADEELLCPHLDVIMQDIQKKIRHVKSKKCCRKPIPIGNKEINRSSGYVIYKPGKYILCDNLYRKNTGTAITVNASDVVIDFNGYTLSGKNSATTGIVVNSSTHLVIVNGAVRNFTVNGISINGGTDIVLDKMSVLQNGNINGPNYTGGLLILNSNYVDINNVNLSENYNFGLGISGSDSVNFINSRSDGTLGIPSVPFGNTAYGIYVSSAGSAGAPFVNGSSNLNFINCNINNTVGLDAAFGFSIGSLSLPDAPVEPNTNILIENCTVNNTMQTNLTPSEGAFAPFVEGITTAGGIGVTYKNCTVDTLTSVMTEVLPSTHVVGIEVAFCTQAIIDGCSVSNAVGITNFVHGLDIEGSGEDITFNNCIAYNIINNSTNPDYLALGFGILKPLYPYPTLNAVGLGTVVQNCIAQDVHGPYGATAAGLLLDAQKNAVIENNIFNNNDYGILADDISAVVSPDLVSSNNLVRGNVTDGNTFYGILDLTTANNAYYGNTARSNGTTPATDNFSGLPAGTPILTWTIGTAPASSFVLDNYSIVP